MNSRRGQTTPASNAGSFAPTRRGEPDVTLPPVNLDLVPPAHRESAQAHLDTVWHIGDTRATLAEHLGSGRIVGRQRVARGRSRLHTLVVDTPLGHTRIQVDRHTYAAITLTEMPDIDVTDAV